MSDIPSTARDVRTSPDVRVGSRLCAAGRPSMTKTTTVSFALGVALMFNPGSFGAGAHAREAKVAREPRGIIVRVPTLRPTPWDYYIVPRYRYRPEDDRVDPCGGPVVPVIRIGPQEATVPLWLANDWGL